MDVSAAESLAHEEDLAINYEALNFEPASILIVDDIDYNRDILRTFLEGFGFTFYEAADGKEALTKVYKHQPDLILLDMKMPEMSGYDASTALSKDAKVNGIPVVAVTASVLTQEEKIISELCDGYLRKPVSKAELIGEVMKHLKYELSEIEEAPDAQQTAAEVKLTGGQLSELTKLYKVEIQPLIDSLIDNPGRISSMMALNSYLEEVAENSSDPNFHQWRKKYQIAYNGMDLDAMKILVESWSKLLRQLERGNE